jgi:glycosyltransferase involved in cell wall biosynthesis
LKIAQVSPRYYPSLGGVESHVQAISERLVKRGFDVDVLTTDSTGNLPKQETINEVRVFRFKSWAPGNAYYFSRALNSHLRENSPHYEVVHAHSYHAMSALYAAQSKAGNKFVFTPHYHGTGHTPFRRLLHIPWKYYAKRIFDESDRVISISKFERNLLIDDFSLSPNKVVLIPDGLNLQEFKSLNRARSAGTQDTLRILCVSRLEKYKGIQYLLRTLARLEDNFVLDIVGDGQFKRALEREAEKLRVSNRVQFHGRLSRQELLDRYRDASIFVLLSKYEAFGIVVAEAIASKLPCVVSRTSALTEWVDNESCFGVDYPIDPEELSRLIRNTAGKSVFSHRRILDWDEITDRITRTYRDLSQLGSAAY